NQQSDFMTNAMGGMVLFIGKPPKPTHSNMNITSELFDIRHNLLKESLVECGVSEDLSKEWLKIDAAFKAVICKKDRSECSLRHDKDKIFDYKNPILS
ncbi:group 1 truncated hemoglobin, partial [bacterium]|nr:group 1 truncated hemoglobin [bacterium]